MTAAGILTLLVAFPAGASARKPIIAYVDQGLLKLHDAEKGKDLAPLPVPIANPNQFRFGISQSGRYVFFNDANKKLHLLDRQRKIEIPLPGIDIYNNPAFLTVNNNGVVAFDNNVNGPAVVYNSSTGQFVTTGFAADNGHRQTQLSGHGRFLATTCMMTCAANLGNDTGPFVQDLSTATDTGAPNVNMSDEEDPCINANGDLVGWQRPNPMQKDIFIYDRGAGSFVDLTGLNSPFDDDTFCVLDAGGDYVGLQREGNPTLLLYERSTNSISAPLPGNIPAPSNNANAVFSAPKCGGRFATAVGTEGRDVFKGTKADDVILGLEGRDKLRGRKGKDVLCGGPGKDDLRGGEGRDRLLGEKGSDDLSGGAGKDVLKGGKGRDDERQ
jgi:Ca2+-binding RTX toxin-like protein